MAEEENKKKEPYGFLKDAPVIKHEGTASNSGMDDDSPLDMGNVAILVDEHCPDGWSAQFQALRGSGAQATCQVILEGPFGNKAAFPVTTVKDLRKVLVYFCRTVTMVYHTDPWHTFESRQFLGVAHSLPEVYDIVNHYIRNEMDGQAMSLSPEEEDQLRTMQQTQTDGDRFEGEIVIETVNIHRRLRE